MEQYQKMYLFLVFFGGTILLATLVFQPYLAVLAVSATLAVVFNRIHEHILRKVKYETLSALLTTIIVLVLVLVPLIIFSIFVFDEAATLYLQVRGGKDVSEFFITIQEKLQVTVPFVDFDPSKYFLMGLEWIIANISSIFARIAQSLFLFALGFFAIYYFIKDGRKLLDTLVKLSPLPSEYDRQIFNRLELSIKAVIMGSVAISVVQGVLVGVGFLIFGVPNSALWGGVAAIAALVPAFGTSLVVIPGILYLFFSSNTLGAIGLTIWGFALVGLIDNFLKPSVIGRQVKIHSFIIFLSVIGGISFFGAMGVILGPLVISLLFASIETYLELNREKRL